MPGLFDPLAIGCLNLPNRIGMSPMCQYRAEGDGVPTDWHRTHYRSRALGGVGLILTEMTDVEPRGRITEGCLGLWNEAQVDGFARIADDVHAEGAKFGIQIAHAGRKSTLQGEIVAPSAIPFARDRPTPRELNREEIQGIAEAFADAAHRAARAGADLVELHGAHGYLLHQFLSPTSNRRDDEYGEPLRFPLEVVRAVRSRLPAHVPLMLRISMREYQPGGYGPEDLLPLLPALVEAGVGAFDVSTGGNGPERPEAYPGYHLRYAAQAREALAVPVASVGQLHHPALAEYAVREELADLVLVGRGLLRMPYWAHEAARALGVGHELSGEYAKGL
jgi:NADPH2 dehydrogenase